MVLFHTFVAADHPSSIYWLIKLRDCALPLMVMASFFLITKSIMQKPDEGFRRFLSRRLKYIWLPMLAWTLVYSLWWMIVMPLLVDGTAVFTLPPLTLLLTGYIHLWFLQFIFGGSLLVYGAARWLKKLDSVSLKIFYWCIVLACGYLIAFYLFLKHYTDLELFYPDADISLKTFVSQIGANAFYVPIAVGLGLVSRQLQELFRNPLFRFLSLAGAMVSLIIHVGTGEIPLTREIYGIAVFIAALQPWGRIPSNSISKLAAHSYGIYIIHFLLAQLFCWLIAFKQLQINGASVVFAGIIIYALSFLFAVLIGKLPLLKWILPSASISAGELPPRRFAKQSEQEDYLPFRVA